MKKIIGLLVVLTACLNFVFASHFVGGDVYVEQTGPNQFTITQRIFREYCHGNASAPTSVTGAAIYENGTNALIQGSITLPRISIDTVIFGDACYTPTGLCVEVHTYQTTVTLSNNPNGYYYTKDDCCRNNAITNMSPDGMTWQAQIPDPALAGGNSSPQFGPYPSDGYFCIGNIKTIDLSCTDADGDSLVYSLVNPTDDGPGPRPIPALAFDPGYSLFNILGPGSLMTIDPATGIISARPGGVGIFVFTVRCEEYRNGVKIGEVFIDLQYEALNCTYDQPPSFPPYSSTATIEFDGNACFDVLATDPNATDTFFMSINSNAVRYGASLTLPAPNVTPSGTYTFTYIDTNTGNPVSLTTAVNQIDDTTFQGVGSVGARFCWNPKSCDVLAIDTFKVDLLAYSEGCDGLNDTLIRTLKIDVTTGTYQSIVPNVFSPNGDKKNDVFSLDATQHDRCYDVLSVAIYNRWGIKVFESEDPLFQWDGKDSGGADVSEGTYYVILQGFFGGKEVTDQFPVSLFR